jgi:hypothetical protein
MDCPVGEQAQSRARAAMRGARVAPDPPGEAEKRFKAFLFIV